MLGACFLLYYAAVNAPSSHMAGGLFIRGRGIFCWQGPPSCCTPCSAGGISGDFPLICTLATGLLLPFFYVNGDVNDLLCKGSVPAMACLLAFLAFTWARHPRLRIWIWLLLALGLAPRFNVPYYCCSSSALQAFLTPCASCTEPSSFPCREWRQLTYAPQARHQDEWGRTMHHPGHRWHPYYSGTPRPWLRFIYRF